MAQAAGDLLLEIRAVDPARPAEQLRSEGDRRSNDLILSLLAESRPGDAVLSEESADDLARVDAERAWIVDPLDGTREFSEPPRVDWAVHVALAVGGVPVAAAVALPGRGLVLSTASPPVAAAPATVPRVVVSRTRPPAVATHLAESLGGELVELGSAGAKVAAVILGEAEVYAHAGGQYEWDSCAPVGVALAAGLHCSRLDGSPLVYNRPDPRLPDLLVCRPELAEAALAAVAGRF